MSRYCKSGSHVWKEPVATVGPSCRKIRRCATCGISYSKKRNESRRAPPAEKLLREIVDAADTTGHNQWTRLGDATEKAKRLIAQIDGVDS